LRKQSIAVAHRLHYAAQLHLYGTRHHFVVPDEAAHDPHRRESAYGRWRVTAEFGISLGSSAGFTHLDDRGGQELQGPLMQQQLM
jgi:hypothetical protein